MLPRGTESRVVTETLASDFGSATAAPAVVRVPAAVSDPRVAALLAAAARVSGVAKVTPAAPCGAAASTFNVVLASDATSTAAQRAVEALRALRRGGAAVGVTGYTASFLDARHSISPTCRWPPGSSR